MKFVAIIVNVMVLYANFLLYRFCAFRPEYFLISSFLIDLYGSHSEVKFVA